MPAKKQIDKFACLMDIEQASFEFYDFLPAERNFFVFQKDLKTCKAVERNIVIG